MIPQGKLHGAFRVPDAVGPITVEADLRTRRVNTSVALEAPRTGRPLTRVNWMLRQLKQAPDDLRVEARFVNAKETTAALLSEVREQPERLLSAADPRRQNRFWTGADLALEIVSPDKPERDLVQKRTDYAEARVQEYWIVHPQTETITVLRLEDGVYVESGYFQRGESA